MRWVGALPATMLILVVLVDAFEVVLLPRRIRHGYRLARIFYRNSWLVGRAIAQLLPAGPTRHAFLSTFGPLSFCTSWSLGHDPRERLRPAALVA